MRKKERKERWEGEREKVIQREKESKLGKQENTSEQGRGLLQEITVKGIFIVRRERASIKKLNFFFWREGT